MPESTIHAATWQDPALGGMMLSLKKDTSAEAIKAAQDIASRAAQNAVQLLNIRAVTVTEDDKLVVLWELPADCAYYEEAAQ